MNRRDIELLSAYLDGQLKPSDSARLESRLKSDPELVAVMDDLRAARNLLRRLPQRRAPRNFTLTRKMVGQNPPLPRAYPFFRLATTLATLLLFFTFGLNFLAPQLAAAPAIGIGGGQGAEPSADLFSQSQPAEAPAAAEVPATEAPAATEPSAELLPMATMMSTLDSERTAESPIEKIDAAGNAVGQDRAQAANEAPVPVSIGWQITLAGIALLGALLMLLMRQSAFQRWRQTE
jgi:anti-sigma factor RsiW